MRMCVDSAERLNDVTDPCSTISAVDVSRQTENKKKRRQCSLFLHCAVIDQELKYPADCIYLFIAGDRYELELYEHHLLKCYEVVQAGC